MFYYITVVDPLRTISCRSISQVWLKKARVVYTMFISMYIKALQIANIIYLMISDGNIQLDNNMWL